MRARAPEKEKRRKTQKVGIYWPEKPLQNLCGVHQAEKWQSILQPYKRLNGEMPAQVAMASAVELLSSPPAMDVKGQTCVCTCVCVYVCLCVHAYLCSFTYFRMVLG